MAAFGCVFTAVSLAATIATALGKSDPLGFVVGLILITCGLWLLWMACTWIRDEDGVAVGGGPLMRVRLLPDERLLARGEGTYREPFGSDRRRAAFFDTTWGRWYVTQRRLIYCPDRFVFYRWPVSIPMDQLTELVPISSGPTPFQPRRLEGFSTVLRNGLTIRVQMSDRDAAQKVRERVAAEGIGATVDTPAVFLYPPRLQEIAFGVVGCLWLIGLLVGLGLTVGLPLFVWLFWGACLASGLVGGLGWNTWRYLSARRHSRLVASN
jgi:hypothetical protein